MKLTDKILLSTLGLACVVILILMVSNTSFILSGLQIILE